jgi:hypothetical protein
MPSEFPQTTPAKPKAPLPGNIQNGSRPGAARPHQKPAPVVGSEAAHRNLRGSLCRQYPWPDTSHSRCEHRPRASHNRHTAEPSPGPGQAGFTTISDPGCGGRRESASLPAIRDRSKASQFAVFLPCSLATAALFFFRLAPYIRGAGSPAMEINDRRNKPFGPGGSTRRLHPSPPFI